MTGAGDPRYLRRSPRGVVVHDDTAEHVALVMRTLRLDEPTFAALLDEYARRCDGDSVDQRLAALAAAFSQVDPRAVRGSPAVDANAAPSPFMPCPVCGSESGPGIVVTVTGASPFCYSRCRHCGHLFLDGGGAPQDIYQSAAYYCARGDDGAGYSGYSQEQDYREEKGRALISWAVARAPKSSARSTLLEVGSGFGYTRAAAERFHGMHTSGVDLSPAAVEAARARYGFATFRGTLAEAREAGAVADHGYDLVLYQFVLEHLHDPVAELACARHVLAPQGHLVLLIPSADAIELELFGASYRSLRRDHLHLFSRRSIERVLACAGLTPVAVESTCALHLLRGMIGNAANALYADGRGPDLQVMARAIP